MSATETLLTLRDVSFSYRPDADTSAFGLAIDALDLNRAETIACIGPSGSGKTTLINLLTGILAPNAGRILHNDFNIAEASEHDRRAWRIANVGMVFQELELLEYLNAFENILLPYFINEQQRADDDARNRARELGEALGVQHTFRRKPARLSQGERQRIAICRALVTDPDLVICDEPTGNLDPTNVGRTLDLLFEHIAAANRTMLMVTHDHSILDRFDRVIRMDELVAAASSSTQGDAA